jgi:hypothetical protein
MTLAAACSSREPAKVEGASEPTAAEGASARLTAFRALAPGLLAEGGEVSFDLEGASVRVRPAKSGAPALEAALPARADEAAVLRDGASGVTARVRLLDAAPRAIATAEGVAVYPGAAPGGGDVVVQAGEGRIEDFVVLERKPADARLRYRVELSPGAGLRSVGGVVEVLDAQGAPRLRVERPYVAARGARASARLSVEGCAVDSDPRAPWGRAVTAPGGAECDLVVDFRDVDVPYPLVVDPVWSLTGKALSSGRRALTATTFSLDADPNDAIPPQTLLLAVGGYDALGAAVGVAELYEPLTRTFAVTGDPTTPRAEHATIALAGTSRVLVSGGNSQSGAATPLATMEVYDGATGTFQSTPSPMAVARSRHTATAFTNALGDAKILLAGGATILSQPTKTADVYDVATGTLTATGNMLTARAQHAAVYLDPAAVTHPSFQGKVLVHGGLNFANVLFTSELYDAATGTFSSSVLGLNLTMSTVRGRARHTATLLPNGNVLFAGGTSGSSYWSDVEIFRTNGKDLGGGAFAFGFTESNPVAMPGAGRAEHTATYAPDGQLVLAGGRDATGPLATTVLYEPNAGTFTTGPSLSAARRDHGADVVPQGLMQEAGQSILLVGGEGASGPIATAELLIKPNGEDCGGDSECLSGHCVTEKSDPNDPSSATLSFCCNEPCDELCHSCQNPKGTCGYYVSQVDLQDVCQTTDPDGPGGAQPYDVAFTVSCVPDGAGAAFVSATNVEVCFPKACNDTSTDCNPGCPCDESAFCDDQLASDTQDQLGCTKTEPTGLALCTPKFDDGDPCSWCYQCKSGLCVDGVCCNSPCGSDLTDPAERINAQCLACDGPQKGVCDAIEDDVPHGAYIGLRPECQAIDPECRGSCGGGVSTCTSLQGVQCRQDECAYDEATLSDGTVRQSGARKLHYTCAADGKCAPAETSCAGYECQSPEGEIPSCKTSCETHADCAAGFLCDRLFDPPGGGDCVAADRDVCWRGIDGAAEATDQKLAADGTISSCAPYACKEDACLTACASVDDCAPVVGTDGKVQERACNRDGQCVARPEAQDIAVGGCAVGAPASGSQGAPGALVAAALAALSRRRRVRRA